MNKAQASSQGSIEGFYDNLEEGLRKAGLVNEQERIWNLDEREFSFVTILQKVVNPKGAVTLYQQTTSEKGETSTVLLTINAAGDSGLSLEIFKWVRLSDEIRKSAPPTTNVNLHLRSLFWKCVRGKVRLKNSRLFMGNATSSDISTVAIAEKSPEENPVIRPNRKKVRIQRPQSDDEETRRQGLLMSPFLNVSHYPRKTKKLSRKTKHNRGEWRKLKTAMSCVVLVQEVLRTSSGEYIGYNAQIVNIGIMRHVRIWESISVTSIKCFGCKYENRLIFFGNFLFCNWDFWTVTKLDLVYHEIRPSS